MASRSERRFSDRHATVGRIRLNETHCANLIAKIQEVLNSPTEGQRGDVLRLALIFMIMNSLILPDNREMIAELTQVFRGASQGVGYYRFMAQSIEGIMEDRDLNSNKRKITTLMGFIVAFAEVVHLPLPPHRGTEATSDDFMRDVRDLVVSMKINLWTLAHGALPNVGAETQQAIEQNYVFFTATMRAVEIEAALTAIQRTVAEVRAEQVPAGGEPDVEPVSRYDIMMQHFRTFCPEWTDEEITDHIEFMDVDPFIDDVQLFLEPMD